VPVQIQDRLIAALRRYCHVLPDPRRGKNTTYAMADFALAAFAPFFMQSPSFLAHQRHLETGHGRSNCETLFGMSKIPGDSQVRAIACPCEGGGSIRSTRLCSTRCSPMSWPSCSSAAGWMPCGSSMATC
jgi:hypothetical protein